MKTEWGTARPRCGVVGASYLFSFFFFFFSSRRRHTRSLRDWSSDVCSSDLLFLGAHDDGLRDLALLHLSVRDRLLDRHDDDVADRGVLPLRAAEHADAHDLLGTRVIGDVESGCRLNHSGGSPLSLLRPFDEFLDAPALVGRQRAALDDLHTIAGLELVLLVVRLVLRPARQVLAVLAIGDAALDQHHAR